MPITIQSNPSGIVAVYHSYTERDEKDGKKKSKKKYLGHIKDDVFIPARHRKSTTGKGITEPIDIPENLPLEVEVVYLRAEVNRLRNLYEKPTVKNSSFPEKKNGQGRKKS